MPETRNQGSVSVVMGDARQNQSHIGIPTDWWRSRDCVVHAGKPLARMDRLALRVAQPMALFKPKDVLEVLQNSQLPEATVAVKVVEEPILSMSSLTPFAEMTGRFLRKERVSTQVAPAVVRMVAQKTSRQVDALAHLFQSPLVVEQKVAPVVAFGFVAKANPVEDVTSGKPVAVQSKRRLSTNPIVWDWSNVESNPIVDLAPVGPETQDVQLPTSLLEALPTALQKILPEILGKALPEAFLRLPMETRQQLVQKIAGMGLNGLHEIKQNWTLSLTEQEQLTRLWPDLWGESTLSARKKAAQEAARKALHLSGHDAVLVAASVVTVKPEPQEPTAATVQVETQAKEVLSPVVQAVEVLSPVVQAVEVLSPVVQAVEVLSPVVQAVEIPSPVVAQAVEVLAVEVEQAVQSPAPQVESEPTSNAVVGADGCLIAVESLGGGMLHLLTDVAGAGLVVTRRIAAPVATSLLPSTFYEQMGGTVYYGGRSVVAGVAGVITGSVGLVVGTAGCLLGAIGSVGRGVLGTPKAAQ